MPIIAVKNNVVGLNIAPSSSDRSAMATSMGRLLTNALIYNLNPGIYVVIVFVCM